MSHSEKSSPHRKVFKRYPSLTLQKKRSSMNNSCMETSRLSPGLDPIPEDTNTTLPSDRIRKVNPLRHMQIMNGSQVLVSEALTPKGSKLSSKSMIMD